MYVCTCVCVYVIRERLRRGHLARPSCLVRVSRHLSICVYECMSYVCMSVIWRARLVTCACLHVPTRCILPPIKSPLMLRFIHITAPPPASWCLRRCCCSSACCGHHLHSLMLRLKHFDASSMLMPGAFSCLEHLDACSMLMHAAF